MYRGKKRCFQALNRFHIHIFNAQLSAKNLGNLSCTKSGKGDTLLLVLSFRHFKASGKDTAASGMLCICLSKPVMKLLGKCHKSIHLRILRAVRCRSSEEHTEGKDSSV